MTSAIESCLLYRGVVGDDASDIFRGDFVGVAGRLMAANFLVRGELFVGELAFFGRSRNGDVESMKGELDVWSPSAVVPAGPSAVRSLFKGDPIFGAFSCNFCGSIVGVAVRF